MLPKATASRVLTATQFPAKRSSRRWLLAAALLLAIACGGGQATVTTDAPAIADTGPRVRGHILEVVARNITEIESLSVRDQNGTRWTFTTEGHAGMTPSHLREHQLFGQQVTVSYVEKDGRLVAVDVRD